MSSQEQQQQQPTEEGGGGSSAAGQRERAAYMKSAGRESRLSFKNFAEHQTRQEFKDEALEICKPYVKEFAECSQEKGLMVIFSCRSFFSKLNECMEKNNSEEAWQKFKASHADEIERRAKMGR
jgi:Cytochrome c oxidase biogenesis protein Cmc1 like